MKIGISSIKSATSSFVTVVPFKVDFFTLISPITSLFSSLMFTISIFAPILFKIFTNPSLLSLINIFSSIISFPLSTPSAIRNAPDDISPGIDMFKGLRLFVGDTVIVLPSLSMFAPIAINILSV